MPFNIDDYSKPPYQAGIMTLTHDECIYVKTECKKIEDAYTPVEPWDNPEPSTTYIISHYNLIDDQEKSINGDTYDCLVGYDVEINQNGINENGIIPTE